MTVVANIGPGLYVKKIPRIQFAPIGLTVPTSGLHVRRIVLNNVIYLKVQNIHTYPFVKPSCVLNLAVQNVFYLQSPLCTIQKLLFVQGRKPSR